jgi:hypothetical protein
MNLKFPSNTEWLVWRKSGRHIKNWPDYMGLLHFNIYDLNRFSKSREPLHWCQVNPPMQKHLKASTSKFS